MLQTACRYGKRNGILRLVAGKARVNQTAAEGYDVAIMYFSFFSPRVLLWFHTALTRRLVQVYYSRKISVCHLFLQIFLPYFTENRNRAVARQDRAIFTDRKRTESCGYSRCALSFFVPRGNLRCLPLHTVRQFTFAMGKADQLLVLLKVTETIKPSMLLPEMS